MASFTIATAPWPVGTSVSVYPAEAWPDATLAPSGPAMATGAVGGANTVNFTGLTAGRRYVAYALGQGVRFGVPLLESAQASVAIPDRERIAALEAAAATGGGGGGGGSANTQTYVWDSDAGTYVLASAPVRHFIGPVNPETLSEFGPLSFGEDWLPTEDPS